MPRRDGTGPMGAGPMIGRGLRFCTEANPFRYEYRQGRRRNLGRGYRFRSGFGRNQNLAQSDKDFLHSKKEMLKERLKIIEEQLENL